MKLCRKFKKTFPFFLFLALLGITLLCATTAQAWSYENPITHYSFTDLIFGVLTSIHSYIAWLAILMIVIAGVMYMISAGSPARMELAKKIFIYALIGFTIAVAAPSLLRQIVEFIQTEPESGSDLIANATTVSTIITNMMQFLLTIIGILGIISFVIAGILYISAGGNQANADKAKKAVFYSILAVAVSGASLIVIQQIIHILSTGST